MKATLFKILISLYGIFYKLVYGYISYLPFVRLYQPVYGQSSKRDVTRSCADRWDVFSQHFPKEKGSVLDIGCNVGFFSFKSAEAGHFAYGVEYHRSNILICNSIKSATNTKNVTFLRHFIDPDFIEKMPAFDTVINLSVFHHWVKAYGLDRAKEMMKVLASKCNCMVFETGQSDEYGSQWPEVLSFMGDTPSEWIESFLKEIGFKDVKNIGTFSTGLTATKRDLFVAKK